MAGREGFTAQAFTSLEEAEGGESHQAGCGALSQEWQPTLGTAAGRSWQMIPQPPLSPSSPLLAPLSPTRARFIGVVAQGPTLGLMLCCRCLEVLNI